MFKIIIIFLFFIFLINSEEIILKDKCDYKMFQHIQCSNLNIKLKYNSSNIVSFITTTQQFCDQFKTECLIEEYYPKLSVIKEKNFKGILKSNENDDDDICMFFYGCYNQTRITYDINIECFEVEMNLISIPMIFIISSVLLLFLILIYLSYQKYKSKKEINELKMKLINEQQNENEEYPIKIKN
jgi:hypothetical protein